MAEKEAKEAPAAKGGGDKDEEGEAPAGPKLILGFKLPAFLLIVLNFLTMAGGFGFVYYWKMVYKPPVITEASSKAQIKKDSELEEKKKLQADGELRMVQLPEMNINLRSKVGGRNHYATLTIAMKCNNDACMEEMKNLRVKVEDTIQTIISARSYQELTMSEASFRLKHEITRSVNTLLKKGTITDTFFSDYTVQ